MGIIFNGDTGVTVPLGAVDAPSIAAQGDSNTGVYFPTTDSVALTQGGAELLRFGPGRLTYPSSALGAASAGLFEYDGISTYFTPVGTQRGVVPGMQTYRLNADVVGANSTAVQSVFGVGVTLNSNTVYRFNALYALSKLSGTTSHSIGLLFGGTATVNNIGYFLIANIKVGFAAQTAPDNVSFIQTTANTAISSTSTANIQQIPYLSGSVSINAGGTFIPQYQLSAAPGGAYTTVTGSYFEIWPVSQSGSNTSIGAWA